MLKSLAQLPLVLLLSGCASTLFENHMEKGLVEIKTQPGTVTLAPATTLTAQPEALKVVVNKDAVHTAPVTVRAIIQPEAFQFVIPDALKIAPVVNTSVSPGAVVFNVPKDAVHFEVAEKAVVVDITLQPKMDTQVEKGAFDFKWPAIAGAGCFILWLVDHWFMHKRQKNFEQHLVRQSERHSAASKPMEQGPVGGKT